jgi:hypothetical protein
MHIRSLCPDWSSSRARTAWRSSGCALLLNGRRINSKRSARIAPSVGNYSWSTPGDLDAPASDRSDHRQQHLDTVNVIRILRYAFLTPSSARL